MKKTDKLPRTVWHDSDGLSIKRPGEMDDKHIETALAFSKKRLYALLNASAGDGDFTRSIKAVRYRIAALEYEKDLRLACGVGRWERERKRGAR